MYFNKDSFNQNKPLEFYVCRPNNQVAAPVIGFENDRMTLNMLDISELSFEVPEYVYLPQKKETVLNPCFSYLSQYMRIMDSCGRIFRINTEPEILETADGRIKTVSADSLECELQDKDIIGLAINMGNELSAEWYDENLNPLGVPENYITFANDSEKRLSLMDILLDYAPNWKLGHVDTELRALRRSFEIDASDLYAVLTQDVARAFECVFLFDTATRTINAFKAANVGRDTHIYLSVHNLIRSKTISPSSDTIYTSFSVLADDNQDILSFANFGSREITNYDYFMNPIWFREETIAKYRAYQTNIETKRERYMQITRDYNYLNTLVTDIYDRVPDDSCETAWTGRSLEELNTELSGYQAAVKYLEDLHTANGVLNIEDSADYGVYISFKDVTIPKLTAQIKAVESGKLKPENTLKWETNWDLYGIHELENRLLVYTDAAAIYQAYADDYNPDIHTESEQLYQMNHQLYLENIEYIHQIEAAIDRRKARLSEYQEEMDRLQAERAEITAYSRMDAPVHGFTSEELEIFESLTVHTDYTNENVFVTDFDDEMTKVDLAKELYDSACEQLAVESRPQLSMQIDLDSFLSMTKYNGFTDELEAGNFIRVGMNSDDAEKLRIIRISFHPSDLSSGLDLKFSSMITTYNRRDDYTYLTGGSRSRSGKNKISAGMTSEDLTTALSALLNSKFASFISSPVFGNASSQNIEAVLGTFEVVLADYLKTKDLTAEVANIGKLAADSAFVTYLQSHFASTEVIDSAYADIETLNAGYVKIATLLSGTASIDSLESIVISAKNAVIDTAYLEDLMAKNITVNHLKAEDINTNKIGLSSEDGSLNITGAAMQFSDDTGVRLQLGKDAEGNFSFILRGENSAVLIDEKGLHENAVTDGLIKTRMLEDGAVDTGKVNWESAGASTDGNGYPVWKSGNIIVEEDGATVTEKFQTISSDIDTQAGEITQLIADTTIVKEDGTTVKMINDYHQTKQTVNSSLDIIGSHTSSINEISSKTNVLEKNLDETRSTLATAENNLNGRIETTKSELQHSFNEFSFRLESSLEESNEEAVILSNISAGKMLYGNPAFALEIPENFSNETFSNYFPGIELYKTANTSVSISKNTSAPVANENSSILSFEASDWFSDTELYIGGFSFPDEARPNGRFVCKIIAKIPENYQIECLETVAGDSCTGKWIGYSKKTEEIEGKNIGTGKWEEYYYYVNCGASGTMGTMFHFCLTGDSRPTPEIPVSWHVCFATDYDISDTSSYIQRLAQNEASINIQKDRIDQVISSTKITVKDLNEDGSETEKEIDVKEMYNRINSSLSETKKEIGNISSDINANTGQVEALSGKLTTIEESLDGVSTTVMSIPESIDDKVDAALASYTMTSEAWMAKFQEALNRQDENGNIIGSTIGEATLSAKGIQFSKGTKKAIFNTEEINVYEDTTRVFGIQKDSVYTNRLLAPNGADFESIKQVPIQIASGEKFLCFVPSGGDS